MMGIEISLKKKNLKKQQLRKARTNLADFLTSRFIVELYQSRHCGIGVQTAAYINERK